MKEQFVSYEIALKLKELGFDAGCLGDYYIIPSDKTPNPNGEFLGLKYEDVSSYTKLVSAPLWQQVIDWFRNKYNLLIDSPKLDELNIGKWSVKITSLDKSTVLEEFVDQPYWRLYRCFRTYEEAREQAILKAIELIKK